MPANSSILLITPPFTQLNTPYPATAYLKGFLKTKGIAAAQMDLGIETILQLFSKKGLTQIFEQVEEKDLDFPSKKVFTQHTKYISTIEEVISFLQCENQELANKINLRNYLPEASRFAHLKELDFAFKQLNNADKAKYLSTLYLEDLGDFITNNIDSHFGFSRYAERLGRSAASFEEIYEELKRPLTMVETIMIEQLVTHFDTVFEDSNLLSVTDENGKEVKEHFDTPLEDSSLLRVTDTHNPKPETRNPKQNLESPKLICFSVPFPGNLFSAFRCAQYLKKHFPNIKTAMGGGFPNTELRSVSDSRVFDFFDFITLDDGERPLLNLMEHLEGKRELKNLKRTFALENNKVNYFNGSLDNDFALRETGTPDYDGLPIKKYISVMEMINPMHRLWSDEQWNKLTLAHGCYWGKCTFCDISLDYIQRYEPANAKMIVDRMEEMIAQNGLTGFHFVDEAAPPSLMKELAIEIIKRKLKVTWWTNIRFEKSFSIDLCRLLKASGCIAVSGGLEVASDRLLALIEKGVTVEQVARVTADFTESGILVHAYLMYGYPTQTIQETVDSLEMVRQLFEADIIQSGFWHRFALTTHSPIAMNPEKYNIEITTTEKGSFANNDLEYIDKTGCDHSQFSEGLKKSLFNYMHGIGFEIPLQDWFEKKIPKPKIDKDFIDDSINQMRLLDPKDHQRVIWLGDVPQTVPVKKKTEFKVKGYKGEPLLMNAEYADWFMSQIENISIKNEKVVTYKEWADTFRERFEHPFAMFYMSGDAERLMEVGLVVV